MAHFPSPPFTARAVLCRVYSCCDGSLWVAFLFSAAMGSPLPLNDDLLQELTLDVNVFFSFSSQPPPSPPPTPFCLALSSISLLSYLG